MVRPTAPPRGGVRGPLLRSAGDPGTQRPPCAGAHGLRPTRSAFRRPPGSTGRCSRTGFPDGGPPFAFAPLQRSVAAPPHRPAGRTGTSDDAPLLGFRALRHVPGRRIRDVGPGIPLPEPACRVRGFGPPSRPPPPSLPARRSAPERPWASPFKAFSSRRRVLLSEPRPSCRSRVGSARSVRSGGTRAASGLRTRRRARSASALAGARADAFVGFSPPGRSPSSPGPSLWSRGLPLHATRRDVHGPRASWGVSGRGDRRGPSRDCRPSWGSPPCDRRGVA